MVPQKGSFWEGGKDSLIFKGTNGRWSEVLKPEEVEKYEKMALEKLGPECAHWLATGKFK
jgi:aryl sulfotransferase